MFTTEECLNDYNELACYSNFHLSSHEGLLDSCIYELLYQEHLSERDKPVWIYIENGNMLSKEMISHIKRMFVLSRCYHLILTLTVMEYEEWLYELACNAGCHIFLNMPLNELERFPSFYLYRSEMPYITYENDDLPLDDLLPYKKCLLKLMEAGTAYNLSSNSKTRAKFNSMVEKMKNRKPKL